MRQPTTTAQHNSKRHKNALMVSNYPSDTAYAWWLMEQFWAILAQELAHSSGGVAYLAYPAISTLSDRVQAAPLRPVALPVIWWLLRMTPPRPREEVFAPLKILARVLKPEETPHQSPWWLTLLRLIMAALLIFALAGPVWTEEQGRVEEGRLVVLVDSSASMAVREGGKARSEQVPDRHPPGHERRRGG